MAEIEKIFPFQDQEIEHSHTEERENYFTGLFNPCNIRYGPKGYLFTREYAKIGKDIYNMEVRPDDTFIVTFPKSGTTWTQELIWLIGNDYDFEGAKESPLAARFPSIDLPIFFTPQILAKLTCGKKLEETENQLPVATDLMAGCPSPRFIKTHQPLSLLPPKLLETCKVVYVARDPRDVAVSFYHYHKLVRNIADDKCFKTYWNFFTRDLIEYTPFFSHIKEAWKVRNHPNMLFLFYEELSQDLAACARRVANFLGKEIKNEHLEKLCEHLHIENFRKNKAVNFEGLRDLGFFNDNESFIRKERLGSEETVHLILSDNTYTISEELLMWKVGGWRDYFDDEMSQQAGLWIQENLLDTDLRFL